MYEVNLRQFSPEGNLAGFRKQLPRLKAMGVGTLWFMPVHPIGVVGRSGTLGSPYAPKDFLQVNPEFGTLADFKTTVDEIHRLGMHVIIDWVAPHTALDHTWVTKHPDWYKRDASGQLVPPMPTWKDVAALNYDVAPMREAMLSAMEFWVREVGVDGFRADSAEFVPLDFWIDARDRLRAIKPVFLLAEGNKPELVAYAFDTAYAWDLTTNMEGIHKGTKSPADLISYLKADAGEVKLNGHRLNYLTNHDKNAWEATTSDQLGAGVDAFTVLSFTVAGMPMIYNGQENGVEKRLNFFERDPISWRKDPAADLYAALALLKRNNAALWNGPTPAPLEFIPTGDAASVVAFKRSVQGDRVVVAVNLSDNPATIPPPAGVGAMRLVIGAADAGDTKDRITLKPWGYCVWSTP